MTELSNKVLETVQNKALPFANMSRRSFLKGALVAGGALALAGCGETTVKTVTVTEKVTVTVTEDAPSAPTKTKNMVTSPMFIMPQYQDCVGCNICVSYCALTHYGELDTYKSNIQVYGIDIKGGMVDIPVLCMKCSDAPCMASCPDKVSAISKDEVTGALLIDHDKCTGCGLCIEACATTVWDPTGNGWGDRTGRTGCLRAHDELGVVGMCDMCSGNPECVTACPENCLRLSAHNSGVPGQYWALNEKELAQQVWNLLYGCK